MTTTVRTSPAGWRRASRAWRADPAATLRWYDRLLAAAVVAAAIVAVAALAAHFSAMAAGLATPWSPR